MAARPDPTGKQALFSTPTTGPRTSASRSNGKTALFSTEARRPGTVVVECSRCDGRTRLSIVRLAMTLLLGSLWLPLLNRDHPQWMVCPACGHRTWCRIAR